MYGYVKQGWQCPICGKIWAPHVSSCYYCNAERKTFASTSADSQTIKVTPFDNTGWWDNYVKNISTNSNINISKNETTSWASPISEIYLEDEQSWRDWLDEMRTSNWKYEFLKENK